MRLCSTPGCTQEAATGHRCRVHQRESNRRFTSEHKSIYATRKWRFTRRRVLFERPLCERCGAIATDVHHRDGYDDPYRLDGLEGLCHSCHSKTTRAEQLTPQGREETDPAAISGIAEWSSARAEKSRG